MTYQDFLLRILLSLGLGFIIGLERQLTGHQAGIRINVLISLGASFFTLFPMLYGSTEVFRIGSSVVTGVGFLCSGVIFKNDGLVRGINTAATLWCTAAIGMMASTGMVWFAVLATSVLVVSNLLLRLLARVIPNITPQDESEKRYRISVTCQEEEEREIRNFLVHAASPKSLYLVNLESEDRSGGAVEVVAEYSSTGRAKDHIMEGIVLQTLAFSTVTGAGWDVF